MIWVLKEPDDEGYGMDWFAINNTLDQYEQDAYVPCHYFDDSQNKNLMYWKYTPRAELITGNYRFFNDLHELTQIVLFEFDKTI